MTEIDGDFYRVEYWGPFGLFWRIVRRDRERLTMGEIRQPIAPLMKQLTLNVRITGMGVMRARLWLGGWLFRFAGLVAGCRCVVQREEKAGG